VNSRSGKRASSGHGGSPRVSITLKEWENYQPVPGSPLQNIYLLDDKEVHDAAHYLAERGMLRLTEVRDGLAVEASSFVGRVRLGNLTVTIQPKITGTPLMRLLCYAYGLRDLTFAGRGAADYASSQEEPFHDLLIHQLAAEVRELTAHGLRREYKRTERRLVSPRGRIDVGYLAREGAAGFLQNASLPCTLYERSGDTALNRALLAGLSLAARLTDDAGLRVSLRGLGTKLEAAGGPTLNQPRAEIGSLLRRARREQSRLTTAYSPALTLIEMLSSAEGPTLGRIEERSVPLPGFLFDMNRLFQALLFRFLSENLPAVYSVRGDRGLCGVFTYHPDYNPRNRQAPTPRPDFAVTSGGNIIALLDAKYRDLWERSLPREMLYQLAVYALSQHGYVPSRREAVILYPCMAVGATEARIEIWNPARRGEHLAIVVLRPVNLLQLVSFIVDGSQVKRGETVAYAEFLAFGEHRSYDLNRSANR
jgi:5-methylcytosine-specific restriction enzyme subunit McrC